MDDVVRTRAPKKVLRKRRGDGRDAATRRLPRRHSVDRIFNDDALRGMDTESAERSLEDFRVRLGTREARRIHNKIERIRESQ